MGNRTTYRAFVFDDDRAVRRMIWTFLDLRGYEVFTFPHPGMCPHFEMKACPCPLEQSCTDVIISDLNMPVSKGLDFIKEQIKKGCHCKHFALMSGDWRAEDLTMAKELGFKVLTKPFQIDELAEWLDEVEQSIDQSRRLSDWWKEHYRQPEGDE